MRDFPGAHDSGGVSSRSSAGEALAEVPESSSLWDGGGLALATFASGVVLGILLAVVLGSLLGGETQAQTVEASPTVESTPPPTLRTFAEILPVYYFIVGPDTDASVIAQAVNDSASVTATRYFVVIPDDEAADAEERRLGEAVQQYVEGGWPVQVIDLR